MERNLITCAYRENGISNGRTVVTATAEWQWNAGNKA